METKICSKCREEKELSKFNKRREGKGGYNSVCKECVHMYVKQPNIAKWNRDYVKNWRKENVDRRREVDRAYYQNNKDHILKLKQKQRSKNKTKINKLRKERRAELCDDYVVDRLRINTELSTKTIRSNPDLIQLKRLEIALKRKRKEITKK